MSRKHLGVLYLTAAVLAASAGALAARWPFHPAQPAPPPPPEQPALTVDPQYLDFGERWIESAELSLTLPVRNDSTRPITVSDVLTGCNCRRVEPSAFTLKPGETRELRLTLTDILRPEYVGRSRPIQIELRPVIDGKHAPGWAVGGVLRPRIESDLPAVMFGESNRVGQPPVPRTVTLHFHQPGKPEVKLVPDVAEVTVRPGAAPVEWKVTVSPRTGRGPGTFEGVLTVANVSPEGKAVASLDLPVDGLLREGE